MKCYSLPVRGSRTASFAERKPRRTSAAAAAERRRRAVDALEQELGRALSATAGRSTRIILERANIDVAALEELTEKERPERVQDVLRGGEVDVVAKRTTLQEHVRQLAARLERPGFYGMTEQDALRQVVTSRVLDTFGLSGEEFEALRESDPDRLSLVYRAIQAGMSAPSADDLERAAARAAEVNADLGTAFAREQERAEGEVTRIVAELQRQGAVHMLEEVATALDDAGVIDSEIELMLARRGGRFDPVELEVARKFAAGMLSTAYEGLSKALSETLTQSLDRGLTDSEIADLLATQLPKTIRRDAYTIARTATTQVYNVGRLREGGAAGDYLWGYRYDVIVDPRTTEICRPLAGKLVAKDRIRFMPPFHYNCRTTLTPILASQYGGPTNPQTNFPDDFEAERVFTEDRMPVFEGEGVPKMPQELPPLGAGGSEANAPRPQTASLPGTDTELVEGMAATPGAAGRPLPRRRR